MNGTERYVRQATRGLSGQARTDAQMELRGAIEDKAWRLTLLGLEPQEAARAALRDLGSPHAIASGLTRVHTLPKAALAAVLAGVATLLGVQALAAVPVVRAIPDPAYKICVYDEALIGSIRSLERVAELRLQLAQPGGRAKLETECKANSPLPMNDLLRLSDFISALIAGGIGVRTLPELDGFLYVTFPDYGSERVLNLSELTKKINGQAYVQTSSVMSYLLGFPDLPLRLTGTTNPVLEIGSAKLQLGTPQTPVLASNIYMSTLFESLDTLIATKDAKTVFIFDGPQSARNQITIRAPENSYVVMISNELLFTPGNETNKFYTARILNVKNGKIAAPFAVGAKGNIVNTPGELVKATENIYPAILVYKLDTSDLRNLKLTPVPAAQIKVLPAR
jgi:hypothetical protein